MLLPRRELSWDTWKDPRTVMDTVNSMTEPTMQPWKKETPRLFWGTVGRDSFEIGLHSGATMRYGSSIIIYGSVAPAEHGSHLKLKMELNNYARPFMRFWFVGVACFFFLLLLFHRPGDGWIGPLTALGMFLVAQVAERIGFKMQADKAEKILRDTFPS